MDEKIHEILEHAGVIHGITKEEVLLIMALGNDELFVSISHILQESLPEEEYTKIMNIFEKQKLILQDAHEKYKNSLDTIYKTAEMESVLENMENLSRNSPQNFEILQKELLAL